jgi:hypothetical protein
MVFSRSFWVFTTIVFAACLNVTMNLLLQRASMRDTFGLSLHSTPFIGALGAGTTAVLLLLIVYRSKMELASGILLLGATSVIVGVTLGLCLGNHLRPLQWALFLLLLVFYFGSWLVRA